MSNSINPTRIITAIMVVTAIIAGGFAGRALFPAVGADAAPSQPSRPAQVEVGTGGDVSRFSIPGGEKFSIPAGSVGGGATVSGGIGGDYDR